MSKNRHSGENRNPENSMRYKNTGNRFSPVWRLFTRASSLTPDFLITLNNQLYTILSHPFYTLHFHRKAAGSGGTPNSLMISFRSAVTSVVG
jgi:hypothetical protein